jgi:hypothetical protein
MKVGIVALMCVFVYGCATNKVCFRYQHNSECVVDVEK